MRFSVFIVFVVLVASVCNAAELSREQRLIVACHKLDIDGVVAALRDGADANGRFGQGNPKLFQDPWSLGWPIAAEKWTPLIAVANSSEYPDPPRKVENTSADLDWAKVQRKGITKEQIEERRKRSVIICQILLSHRVEIDADDGYGATALYDAVDSKNLELAKLLVRFDAKVNTKTGVYIDGPGGLTPLHEAFWSAELTKLLLDKGADPKAKDTKGETPGDWARKFGDAAVARLYE